jgi:hypothetical protein
MSDNKTTEELAEAAFVAAEIFRTHQMANVPADYEARKAAAIAYAAAQEAHSKAQTALQDRVTGRDAVYSLTEVLPKTQKHL